MQTEPMSWWVSDQWTKDTKSGKGSRGRLVDVTAKPSMCSLWVSLDKSQLKMVKKQIKRKDIKVLSGPVLRTLGRKAEEKRNSK